MLPKDLKTTGESISLVEKIGIYNTRIAELKKTSKWKSLNTLIQTLMDKKIWDHEIAYVFAVQKEEDLKNFVSYLSSISTEFSPAIHKALVTYPAQALQVLAGIRALQKSYSLSSLVEPEGAETYISLLLKHPAEAYALAQAMVKLHELNRLNGATLLVLDVHPQNARDFAKSGGRIPNDFKVDTTDLLAERGRELVAKYVLSEASGVRLNEILHELAEAKLLDQKLTLAVLAQQDDDVITFLENLLLVGRIEMPDDVRQELYTAKPDDALLLLIMLKELCEFNPSLYRHPQVRDLLIKNDFQESHPLDQIKPWFALLAETKCWDESTENASIAKISFFPRLIKTANLLKEHGLLDEETIWALLENAHYAENLSQGLVLLSTDPKLYDESYQYLIDHPKNAVKSAEQFLQFKAKLQPLPAAESLSRETLQAIGKEVMQKCFSLRPKQLERLSKNGSIMQNVGFAFINSANQVMSDQSNNLPVDVALAVADLMDVERIILKEKAGDLLQESTEEVDDDMEEEGVRFDLQHLHACQDSFIRFFEIVFEEENLLQKWHHIFSILAAAVNDVNYQKQNFHNLLATEAKKTDRQISVPIMLADWGSAILQQLNPTREEEKKVTKAEVTSGPTLSQFLDTNNTDDKALQSFGAYLKTLENIPFEKFSLPILYAVNKILRNVKPASFYGVHDKSECLDAIRQQLTRKDPAQKFFKLSPSQVDLFNSIWGEDEPQAINDSNLTSKKPSKDKG